MVKIDSLSFGSIVIDGKKYRRDVMLLPDGTVRRRTASIWTWDSFKREEIEELSRVEADVYMVGRGVIPRARLTAEAKSLIDEVKLEITSLPSREAIKRINQRSFTNKDLILSLAPEGGFFRF